MLSDFYDRIGYTLDISGVKSGQMKEVVGLSFNSPDFYIDQIEREARYFEQYLMAKSYPLELRQNMEKYHYGKLYNSLVHALAENYYYLKEKVGETRRVVALSSDCISVIQCMCRDDTLRMQVFMRSSHYANLFPVDLLFLMRSAPRFIESAKELQKTFQADTWGTSLDDLSKFELNISFGSLHTNIKPE